MRLFFFLLILFIQTNTSLADDDFPGRPIYPGVTPISLEDLHAKQGNYSIVDVRSEYEYDTLHIKNAVNIPLANADFADQVRQLQNSQQKTIAFYCNGHTCMKSYKATDKAQKNGIDNTVAFDAGVFDWVTAYPQDAVLLGRSPVELNQLISKEKLNAHMMTPEAFATMANTEQVIVLDIRDRFQREGISLFPGKEIAIPLDNEQLANYVKQSNEQGIPLLIYDAAGKQVRWLQYYLESAKAKEYYFMERGADGFYNDILGH